MGLFHDLFNLWLPFRFIRAILHIWSGSQAGRQVSNTEPSPSFLQCHGWTAVWAKLCFPSQDKSIRRAKFAFGLDLDSTWTFQLCGSMTICIYIVSRPWPFERVSHQSLPSAILYKGISSHEKWHRYDYHEFSLFLLKWSAKSKACHWPYKSAHLFSPLILSRLKMRFNTN